MRPSSMFDNFWRDWTMQVWLLAWKCYFLLYSLTTSGMLFPQGTLRFQQGRLTRCADFEHPSNLTDPLSFLGLCNVFPRFLPILACVAIPLNKKLQKGQSQTFDVLPNAKSKPLGTLKSKIDGATNTRAARSLGDYAVENGACDKKTGCILLQRKPDGTDRSTRYWSCRLNSADRVFNMMHRECLPVVWALLVLQSFLEGYWFTRRTDHDVMKWILNITDPRRELMRWPLNFPSSFSTLGKNQGL